MIEDDKGRRNARCRRGRRPDAWPQAARFRPQLTETRVHLIGQFLGALMLLGQAVELGLRGIQGGLIFADRSTAFG